MIEIIVISESITACIVGRIYVYELHFSCEFLPERVEGNEIISLDQEILSQIPILIPESYLIRILDSVYTVRINFLESSQYLRISENIDIRSIECLVEELLFSSRLFIRHTSLEDAVFEGKREDHIPRTIDEGLLFGIKEPDFVRIVSDPSLAERIFHRKRHLQK